MSSSPRGARPGSNSTKSRPPVKTASQKLNRAQIQAMEIRSAATVVEQHDGGTGAAFIETTTETPRRGSGVKAVKRPVAKPVLLTRAQEYAYVRSDLRRLVVTAGSLFAIMIVLLFLVEH